MKTFFKKRVARAPHHKITLVITVASTFLIISGIWWAYVALSDISQPLIIRFTNVNGITGIGRIGDLMAVGVFGIMATLINGYLAWELDDRAPVFSRAMMMGTAFLALLLFIGFAAIINVN